MPAPTAALVNGMIEECRLKTPVRATYRSGRVISHQGTWTIRLADTDKEVSGDNVHRRLVGDQIVAICQGVVGTPPAFNTPLPGSWEPIPRMGDALVWSENGYPLSSASGSPFGGDLGTWANAELGRWVDPTAYALEFNPEPVSEGGMSWDVTVTWRQPDNNSFELPQFTSLITTPGFSSLPGPTEFTPNPATWDPAWQAARTFKWEYVPETRLVTDGWEVVSGVPQPGDPKPMKSTNGEEFSPYEATDFAAVLTIQQLAKTGDYAHVLNENFHRTINDSVRVLGGIIVPPYKGRYLRSEATDPIRFQGSEYVQVETRIEISNTEHFIDRAAFGSWYYEAGFEYKVPKDSLGHTLSRVPLTGAGDLATPMHDPTDQETLTFSIYRPVDYSYFVF